MHNQHDVFIDAIHTKNKLRIRFYSEDDGGYIERVCAPMDYAAGTKIKDGVPRYWVWDFESDKANHTLPLREERIQYMIDTGESFEPGSFVSWNPAWVIGRDWGQYS
ncbi:Hypothetical protein AKI40_1359 [Enterobacter sp. FY-07]|uniref:hypothetical protein n=1 Tax=Kosakonia oryzendophytica TaxID=1005665 RepID=UPI000777CD11|nr:hypothetical protein [Kosakonia oryzendophytica]AMO47775.1 Hypothetical protein AKI40_1359 [Enterobacter sp. FY-07]WBT59467.1 hypothetical protein O9K67_06720 [Kosakonia oryzendophytica]